MVLARKVGKQRPFWRGLLLTVVTVGIYALYWNYKAPNEVYRQFELSREGRDEGVVWYILGLVLFPFLFPYLWMMVGNVRYVRTRLGLEKSLSPGLFVGLVASAFVAYFVGAFVLLAAVGMQPAEASDEQLQEASARGLPAFLLGLTAVLVLLPLAYHRLQRDINGVWRAYDARMHELGDVAAPWRPEAASPPQGAAPPPPPRYYADRPRPPEKE